MTNSLRICLLAGLSALGCALAQSQSEPAQRHQRVIEFLKKTAAQICDQSLAEIKTLDDWNRQRPQARRELLYTLGLDPLPKRTPLKARVTGTLRRPKYRIEKVVFQSSPGLYVTGNLYVPNKPNDPATQRPAILYVCGHSPHPLGAKWDYQDRVIWYAENGYVCLILDTLEFGEVPGIHHGIHDLNMFDWLSRGYTPVGVEVWNAMRAVDYLESRPEVDGRRIGMTGISGGGSVTWFTAAVEDRIAAAGPVCSTYTIGSQAAHWTAAGQCDCIYVHNTFLTDLPMVAALIAPRPLIICSGQKDGDFPPDGYHEVYRRAKRIFDLYPRPAGEPERILEVDDNVGHTDAPLFRKEVRQWMNRWLKNDTAPLTTPAPDSRRETAEDLACLKNLPVDAVNYRIHELFIPTAVLEKPKSLASWENRRSEVVRELKDKVFRWFPREKIPFKTTISRNNGGWASRYAEYKDVAFESEQGVTIRAQLLRPRKSAIRNPQSAIEDLLIYVKRPGDSIYFLDLDELLPLLGRCAVLILNPRLTEHPVSAFENAEIERTASWIGRTVASMQVWDILRAVEWVTTEEGISPSSISLYGKGDMGILSLYAGLFDARIQQIVLRDPPATHRQSPALLNVLRITDIPEVAGAFAPRKLVFLREIPTAFDFTRGIYKLHGLSGNLKTAGSMPEALEVWKYERGSGASQE